MTIPVRITDDKRAVITTQETTVEWQYAGEPHERTIPAGYEARPGVGLLTVMVLSLTTYPLALWNAAVLHDYLYEEREEGSEISRAKADAALLADEQDPRWLAWTAWAVVRTAGWTVW